MVYVAVKSHIRGYKYFYATYRKRFYLNVKCIVVQNSHERHTFSPLVMIYVAMRGKNRLSSNLLSNDKMNLHFRYDISFVAFQGEICCFVLCKKHSVLRTSLTSSRWFLLCLIYFKITWALAIPLENRHKKCEINRTKIKGGCQSGRKVVKQNSKNDLPLIIKNPSFI